MHYANLPPSADFFLSREKVVLLFCPSPSREKGGHTMEIETDEPIPTASQQALSGSNAGHLTVDFDSEDANYRAQVDELVRTIESMPFVSKLSQLGAPRPGFQSSLMCYAARGYKSCGCKQRKVVQLTQHRATLLACLQDLSQQLQASHGQNCIDAAHALAHEQAAAAASRPPARDENAMASMMHLAQIRSRLEAATKRAVAANAACLAAEREKDAAQQAVQELERELQFHCPKRARTAQQDDEPTEAVAEWDLSTFRREFTRVSGRRNIAITDRQHCIETRRGKYNFLNHPRLGLLGWMAYWSHGVQSIVVAMIVDLIKELGLTQQVIAGLPEGQEARAQAATNEHIVDRLKACLSELKHGQKRQTEEQRKQYILLLAAVMPVRARERDSAGWIRRVCERLDVSRGSRNARQYAAEKAIDLRAGFDQAVENSNRPLQEGDTVMAHGDVCVLKEISKLEVLVCIMLACTWCGAWM